MDIGFIGIGQMGRHMVSRIWGAGNTPHIYDINKAAAAPLLRKGMKWAGSPAEVARACRIVFTSLPAPKDVEQVVYGDKGLKKSWQHGDIYYRHEYQFAIGYKAYCGRRG